MEYDKNKPLSIGDKYIRTRIKDGKVTVEAFGFQGTTCQDATRDLEQRLGSVEQRTAKEELGGELQQTN